MENKKYLNVALPKGRLGEKVYSYFEREGMEAAGIREESRKLVFENAEGTLRFFWVKPSDVAIYVERGAADIGVAGKDILLEYPPDVYELFDLELGKCRMAVAAKSDFIDDRSKTLRVATKFTNIAGQYYASLGRRIDIIKLNGSKHPQGERPCGIQQNLRYQRTAYRQQGEHEIQGRADNARLPCF